ncbi:ArsB/NhaD family transporter [Sporomusa acidovorans]|uniref:Transporter n=1 Tax=Sporomusa acidovorans (strain ATCC 49682 / DSM 3132 / Mol) TaxID=1123286 RepID=A0ABZ3IY70_SPOA4|nr:ArsB/NhaD family transporter [Sporomusa acidovorans]OZC22215.1 Na(+)/H(+) antiporter NhaD [Sporomusa acidovorans DSM 3132]SDE81435.1 Na+/H+ antiporter NhaD [Sporomusa acidovorans]
MANQATIAIGIFLIAYGLIISEKIHRTIVALAGAVLVIMFGVLTQEQAIHHIDFNTLGLLVGMMVIVAITGETGLFRFLAIWAAKAVGGNPLKLMVALSFITALCSALLDNVTTVLLIVPVTLSITKQLNVKPAPYLISQIIAANIGGTATLIGDPPNIMIGSAVKELDFLAFINNLAGISFAILIVTILLLALIYRKQLRTTKELSEKIMSLDPGKQIKNSKLLRISLAVLALTVTLFFFHQQLHMESATVAIFGAVLLLILAKKNSDHELESIFHKVEWVALLFFVGLFILVGGLVDTGVISLLAQKSMELTAGNPVTTAMLILWLSALASAFVDNIPFVATMIPLIKDMGALGITNLEPLWWSLALGACLGGNGTLVGASANVIVAGLAAQEGYPLSFMRFLKIAFPLMLLSILMASAYVYLRYLM